MTVTRVSGNAGKLIGEIRGGHKGSEPITQYFDKSKAAMRTARDKEWNKVASSTERGGINVQSYKQIRRFGSAPESVRMAKITQ